MDKVRPFSTIEYPLNDQDRRIDGQTEILTDVYC